LHTTGRTSFVESFSPGPGRAGGEGISGVGAVVQEAPQKAEAENKHPTRFLFFSQTTQGQVPA
jgi:hypothetical protein